MNDRYDTFGVFVSIFAGLTVATILIIALLNAEADISTLKQHMIKGNIAEYDGTTGRFTITYNKENE